MVFNLGDITEGTTFVTSIPYTGKKDIKYIEPSCSCMSVRYDRKNKKIYLTYKAGIIDHLTLTKIGHQIISRYLSVRYKDGSSEQIKVIGKVIKK